MSENSKIEWTDHTFNPWEGCQKVGPGCDHCYAETRNARFGGGVAVNWGPGAPRRRTSDANWRKPVAWNARHAEFFAEHGRRRRVFCASLADVFDNAVPDEWRDDLWRLIAQTPNLDWLLLTKRIGNVGNMLPIPFDFEHVYPHVWIGATIVNQAEADRDIPKLLATPAALRFLSMEPLLGPVDLTRVMRSERDGDWTYCDNALTGFRAHKCGGSTDPRNTVHWVIVGGESGLGARPMHPDWTRGLRDQCAAAGVPFLFKQHGEWAPGSGDFGGGRYETAAIARDGRVVAGGYAAGAYPAGASSADGWTMVHRVGKKAAGRLLDDQQHDGFPNE